MFYSYNGSEILVNCATIPNSDVSGIGVRGALYLQAAMMIILSMLKQRPSDILFSNLLKRPPWLLSVPPILIRRSMFPILLSPVIFLYSSQPAAFPLTIYYLRHFGPEPPTKSLLDYGCWTSFSVPFWCFLIITFGQRYWGFRRTPPFARKALVSGPFGQ